MPSTKFSSPRRHHHHHDNHFPPREYTDLSRQDIELLTAVIAPAPTPGTPASATYTSSTRQLISDLPSHLRSKIPLLSTFCSLHNKVNPLPLISILSVIQHQVSPSRLSGYQSNNTHKPTLILLEDLNALFLSPEAFREQYNRDPSPSFQPRNKEKCAACKLTLISRSIPTLTALGGAIIAHLEPRLWKKSKRIQWMESWVKVCVEWKYMEEGVVREMWECGARLREGCFSGRRSGEEEEGRAYIDEFIARANPAPARPRRSREQEDHVDVAQGMLETYPAEGNPFGDEGEVEDRFSNEPLLRLEPRPRTRVPASSVYSRQVWQTDSFLENEVIDMYDRREDEHEAHGTNFI